MILNEAARFVVDQSVFVHARARRALPGSTTKHAYAEKTDA